MRPEEKTGRLAGLTHSFARSCDKSRGKRLNRIVARNFFAIPNALSTTPRLIGAPIAQQRARSTTHRPDTLRGEDLEGESVELEPGLEPSWILEVAFADCTRAVSRRRSRSRGQSASTLRLPKSSARQSYEAKPRPAPKGAPSPVTGTPLGVQFVDVAKEAGLNVETIFGGEHRNKYLLETTGCGAAFFDYDQDDWVDIFLVNGWRLEGFPKGNEPVCHLFKNNRDGTFTDVTIKAGLARSGWGQACCVGDYNNDGWNDLFVSYYGQNALFRNNGNGTFTDVTKEAGLLQDRLRWNSGCAFLDYDKDGHLDLFVGNYIDLDLKTTPLPEDANCTYKGIVVACGPPGLEGGKNLLYHNNGDGTFTDVSEKAGMWGTLGTYALSCGVADLDQDRLAQYLCRQRFHFGHVLRESERRHIQRPGHRSGRCLFARRQAAGGHGRFHRRLQSRRACSTS